jgi:hypothetical protein
MIEIVIVGFAVLLMVLPAIGTVARLTEARSNVHAAARDGAVWVARHGGEPPDVDGIDVSVVESDASVRVVATRDVDLIGVLGASIARTVRATVTVPVSAYRSAP